MKVTHHSYPVTHIAYESMTDMFQTKPHKINTEMAADLERKLRYTRDPSWYGCRGENLLEYTRNGWPKGHKEMMGMASKLERFTAPLVNVPRKRLVRDRQGAEYDIHTANMGRLDRAWTERRRKNKQRPPRVCIAIECSATANYSNRDMFGGPCTGLLLADALVRAKLQVMIVAYAFSEHCFDTDNYRCLTTTVMKQYSEKINTMKLSGLCLSGWFRYHGFMSRLATDKKVWSGMGITLYRRKMEDAWKWGDMAFAQYKDTDRVIYVPHRAESDIIPSLKRAVNVIAQSQSQFVNV